MPAAKITPPANAIQSPVFSGKGSIVCSLKTIHNPPSATARDTARCQPGFFLKIIFQK